MAAGFVTHDITTADGVTFTVVSWVPNTSSPDVGNVPAHILRDSTGTEVLTAANVTSLLGYVDGLETLIGSTNTKLDTIHTDLGTTLAGYVDGLETLIGSTNTALAAATPAGTNLIGRVSASHETSTIYNGTTALTPKFAKVSCSSSGANTIVAAVTSKKIRVLAWDVIPSAAVDFKWQSHVTPTDLTGLFYTSGKGNGVARGYNPVGYFETVSGEALDLNLSSAVAVGGSLVYVEV